MQRHFTLRVDIDRLIDIDLVFLGRVLHRLRRVGVVAVTRGVHSSHRVLVVIQLREQ